MKLSKKFLILYILGGVFLNAENDYFNIDLYKDKKMKQSKEIENEIKTNILELNFKKNEFVTNEWVDIKKVISNYNITEDNKTELLKNIIKDLKEESSLKENDVFKNIVDIRVLRSQLYDKFVARSKLEQQLNQLEKNLETNKKMYLKVKDSSNIEGYRIVVNKFYYDNDIPKEYIKNFSSELARYKASFGAEKELVTFVKGYKNNDVDIVKEFYPEPITESEYLYDDFDFDTQKQKLIAIYRVKLKNGNSIEQPVNKYIDLDDSLEVVNSVDEIGQNNGVLGINGDYLITFDLPGESLIKANQFISDNIYENKVDETSFNLYKNKFIEYHNISKKLEKRIKKVINAIGTINEDITALLTDNMTNEFINLNRSCIEYNGAKKAEKNSLIELDKTIYKQKYPVFMHVINKNELSANELTQNMAIGLYESVLKKLDKKKFDKWILSSNAYDYNNTIQHKVEISTNMDSIKYYGRTYDTVLNIGRYGLGGVFEIHNDVDVSNLDEFEVPSVRECFNNNGFFKNEGVALFKDLTSNDIDFINLLQDNNASKSKINEFITNLLNFESENTYIIYNDKKFITQEMYEEECKKEKYYGEAVSEDKIEAIKNAKVDLAKKFVDVESFYRDFIIKDCRKSVQTNNEICQEEYDSIYSEMFRAVLSIDGRKTKSEAENGKVRATVYPVCNKEGYEDFLKNKSGILNAELAKSISDNFDKNLQKVIESNKNKTFNEMVLLLEENIDNLKVNEVKLKEEHKKEIIEYFKNFTRTIKDNLRVALHESVKNFKNKEVSVIARLYFDKLLELGSEDQIVFKQYLEKPLDIEVDRIHTLLNNTLYENAKYKSTINYNARSDTKEINRTINGLKLIIESFGSQQVNLVIKSLEYVLDIDPKLDYLILTDYEKAVEYLNLKIDEFEKVMFQKLNVLKIKYENEIKEI